MFILCIGWVQEVCLFIFKDILSNALCKRKAWLLIGFLISLERPADGNLAFGYNIVGWMVFRVGEIGWLYVWKVEIDVNFAFLIGFCLEIEFDKIGFGLSGIKVDGVLVIVDVGLVGEFIGGEIDEVKYIDEYL